MSMIDHKMIQAFGVPLLNSEGEWKNDMWEKIWKRTIALWAKLYTLPGGAIGRQFVSIFAAEVSSFAKGETKSEISICFPPLILQRDKNIVKTADIRRLISRRLQHWKDKRYLELISEAEECNRKLPLSQPKITEDKAIEIFTRLLLSGKIRAATRFITERMESGGLMLPEEDAVKPAGKTVLEVLKLKHPDQADPHSDAYIHCDELPTLIDITITESHIHKVAHKLSGLISRTERN